MGFEGLLGNARLRENLSNSISRGHISHCYLICGPEGAGKKTLARLLAAAILCTGSGKPCGTCGPCRKVLSGTHPDFITVDDPEKKTVTVDLIRNARSDIYVRPNEAEHKIYCFPRAQDMGIPGQNALLKVLEEPPSYGVFLLLTDNPERLLPTVRSRCTQLELTALPEQLLRSALSQKFPQADPEALSAAVARSGGYLGQALALLENGSAPCPQTQAFAESFLKRDRLLLVQTLVPMEKWKREQLLEVLIQWQELLHGALLCRSGGMPSMSASRQLASQRSARELMSAITHLQKAITYTQSNVSVAAVCGYLSRFLR